MQKERLVIKNFGPIRSVDLELGKMTILIGEQATGKSTIVKLLAVCRYFSYIADKFENNDDYFSIGLENWGISNFIRPHSRIEYYSKHYDIKAKAIKGDEDPWVSEKINNMYFFKITLTANTEEFRKLLSEYENIKKKNYHLNIPVFFYQDKVAGVLKNPFYIPTERGLQSIFSLGRNSIQNLSDTLFVQFAKLDQIARSFKGNVNIEPLGISYKNENGIGKIKKKNEKFFYTLNESASGYQSAIPIILTIKHYNEKKKQKTIIIEEPEINLFPGTQKNLVDFIAESINKNNHQFLIPTHSPYILSALNNLIYAYKVASNENLYQEVEKIIPKKYWLKPKDVEVYLLKDGKAQSLIDKKDALISIDYLDSVSEQINETFDKLISLEN